MIRSFFFAVFSLVMVSGCATKHQSAPQLDDLYNRAAQHQELERNPIVVIPGILGSRLVDSASDRVVWGAFGGESVNPKKSEDARLFSLPMRQGVHVQDLRDRVVPDGALDRLQLNFFRLPIQLSAYVHILKALGVGGYRDQQLAEAGAVDYGSDHFTCFQFAYDWRLDLATNAKKLDEFLIQKRRYVREEMKKRFGKAPETIKFDIVAHSMGGLLTRYYLRFGANDLPVDGSLPKVTWAGTRKVEKVVLIGTPSGGSVSSLKQLVEGTKFGPFLPKYEASLLGTMPAIYQLLPRTRHKSVVWKDEPERSVYVIDVQLWRELGWGLASPNADKQLKAILPDVASKEERAAIAFDHLQKSLTRAKRIAEALDQKAFLPDGFSLSLFAGDAVETASVLGVGKDGSLEVLDYAAGDGTVIRQSALLDERMGQPWRPRLRSPIDWTNVTFLFTNHLGLTKDPVFIDNILYFLLEKPTN